MNDQRLFVIPALQQGVVLLEALIAILIFSLGILGAVGLQATMVKGATEAKYRAEAGYIVQQRIGEIWVNGAGTIPSYVEYPYTDISASSGLPSGKRTTLVSSGTCAGDPTCVTVRVTWKQPGGDTHNVTTVARITPP